MRLPVALRLTLLVSFISLLCSIPLVGQWQAHFTDSLSLSPSVWQGTLDKFRCDPIRGLQLYDKAPKGTGNYSYIKTGIPLSKQMTWHGKIRVDYTPTRSNNVKLLLYCYEALPDGSFNYVLLQMSDKQHLTLSECNLRLEPSGKVKPLSSEPILQYDYFDEMRQGGGTVYFVIQYDPTAEGRWTMWIKHEADQLYQLAGSAGDTPPAPSKYQKCTLLFGCEYSKTRAEHSSLEYLDVYPTLVTPEQLDREHEVIRAEDFYRSFTQTDPHTVDVLCATAPDLSSATISVTPSWGELTVTSGGKLIHISTQRAIPEGLYALALRGVRTSSGSQVENAIYEIAIDYDSPTPPPSSQDSVSLIFSEFMANPLSGASEYIELHNPSSQAIDARGYSIGIWRQGRVTRWYPLSDHSCIVPAGAYHAFTTSIEGITAFYDAPQDSLTQSKALPQLANKGFTIELLRHADSTVVEQFRYDPALLGKKQSQRGVALERYISSTAKGTRETIWGAALPQAHYATPGQRNSFHPQGETPSDTTTSRSPQSLCITEIMARPTVDGSEYIELYNPSDSLSVETSSFGLVIAQSGHPSKVVPLPAHPSGGIPPRSYLALTPSTHPLERLYYAHPDSLLLFDNMPKIPDSDCAIRLVYLANDSIVEEVYYDIKYLPPDLQKVRGIALERIIPDQQPQAVTNWAAAKEWANYGTPGRQNSVYGLTTTPDDRDDLPKRRTPLPLQRLASLTLQELVDGKTTCSAIVYSIAGHPLMRYDHDETERLCRAIVERQSLSDVLPPTLSTRAILIVELRHPDQKRPNRLVSILAN